MNRTKGVLIALILDVVVLIGGLAVAANGSATGWAIVAVSVANGGLLYSLWAKARRDST